MTTIYHVLEGFARFLFDAPEDVFEAGRFEPEVAVDLLVLPDDAVEFLETVDCLTVVASDCVFAALTEDGLLTVLPEDADDAVLLLDVDEPLDVDVP